MFEYGMSGKWLELLKEVAPRVTRAAVLRDPAVVSGIGQFAALQVVAPSLGMELGPVDVRDTGEIERAVTAFARFMNGGLIVTASALATRHRNLDYHDEEDGKLGPEIHPCNPHALLRSHTVIADRSSVNLSMRLR